MQKLLKLLERLFDMYLYGASGHAKVIKDVLASQGITVLGLVDDDLSLDEFEGMPVSHSAEGLSPLIVSIGNCQMRKQVVEKLGDITFGTAIHKSAIIAPGVTIDHGSVIMAGTILQPGVSIGQHSIVNTGASIDHDCLIDRFVHIAPHCTLCGDVHVGEGTWLGAGSTVIQGVHIGKNCYIGAGSVVVKDIPDNSFCFGNPCRVQRNNLEEF